MLSRYFYILSNAIRVYSNDVKLLTTRGKRFKTILLFCLTAIMLAGCSSSKYIDDDNSLLTKNTIESVGKDIDITAFDDYIRQKPNTKWFSLFKVPMSTYCLAGRDSSKWINRLLHKMGEAPVVYDSVMAYQTCGDMTAALHNMGYLNGNATFSSVTKGKKTKVNYVLTPSCSFNVRRFDVMVDDTALLPVLKEKAFDKCLIKSGSRFSIDALNNERRRITEILNNEGYYKFNKDFISFEADSTVGNHQIDVLMHIYRYRPNNNSPEVDHKRYTIGNVNFTSSDGKDIPLRRSVLRDNTALHEGGVYNAKALQQTYNNFARLSAVRYTNIRFDERPDSSLLDCNLQVSMNKPNSISFQPEGTNTAGDLGAAGTLSYSNRNLFRGSEVFSVQLRAAFEAITGLEGYQNQNYEEYSIESKLLFPRFLAPFLSQSFRRNSTAKSELALSYNLQNRPEFHRRVFTAAWRYRWGETHHHSSYRLDLIDLNYVYMPWISKRFKEDYLDDASNRNAILRYNYEDLFIMKIGAGLTYNNGINVFRANVETAGNILNGFAKALGTHTNTEGQYTLFNIAYAQYVKADIDFTHIVNFDVRNSLAMHVGLGVAYPYGNSKILPFEKRYFSGGASSVRGWNVRELGPGKFKGTDGRIDFINQTGDMKLDLNVEWRTFLFWKLNSALFVDAGNNWTIRSYADQPGGQFKINEFYKQIAVAYGMGLRLNFDYFILRFDFGMKAVNPAYETRREHYPLLYPNFSRDLSFHFAVGMPF